MAVKKSSTTRKGLAIGLAAIGIAGLSLASAAQLNLTGGQLQAGTVAVQSCQTAAIPVTFTSIYTVASSGYTVSTVRLSAVEAGCVGKPVKANLLRTDGTILGVELTTTAVLTVTSFTVPAGTVLAADVAKVAVILSD